MESFLSFAGFALVILAFGFLFNGFPNLVNIENNYYGKDEPKEEAETEE